MATSRKLRVRLDFDAGHDGFHVAAVVEQRRQACPALLAHAVALVEDGDAAADHGGDQRRGDVAQASLAGDHRGDQQIFGAGIEGGLEDVDVASHAPAGGVGEGGLADTRLAQQPRIHGQVLLVHHHPRGQQLAHQFVLSHPLHCKLVGVRQVQGYPLDLDRHRLSPIIGYSAGSCPSSIARSAAGRTAGGFYDAAKRCWRPYTPMGTLPAWFCRLDPVTMLRPFDPVLLKPSRYRRYTLHDTAPVNEKCLILFCFKGHSISQQMDAALHG